MKSQIIACIHQILRYVPIWSYIVHTHIHLRAAASNTLSGVDGVITAEHLKRPTGTLSINKQQIDHDHRDDVSTFLWTSQSESKRQCFLVFMTKVSYRCAQTGNMCGFQPVCCCDDPTRTEPPQLFHAELARNEQRRFRAVTDQLVNHGPPPGFLPQQLTVSCLILFKLLRRDHRVQLWA